jgi:hypothetical protein
MSERNAEQWRSIPGHKGYEASSNGRVRSVPRTLSDRREAGGVVLTPTLDKDCYWRVKLGSRTVPVHVAVTLAFHGRPEVRHLNGHQQDNTPGNLAWGSRRENERDKKRAGGKEDRAATRPFRVGTSRTGDLRLCRRHSPPTSSVPS